MSGHKQRQRWFERYPDLYAKQTDILNAAGFKLDQQTLEREGRIQFIGFSKADPTRQLIIAFPEAFPSAAPKIRDTVASKLLVHHHRIDSRQFCVFGFNEGRWTANRSVAEALAEVEDLIAKFKDGNPLPDHEPPEPITRSIQYYPAAILVPPPLSEFTDFASIPSKSGKFTGKFDFEGQQKIETRGRGIILEANFGHKKLNCPRPFPELFKNSGKEIHGDWFYLETMPTQENLPEVVNQCYLRAKASKKADFYWLALIFMEEAGTAHGRRLTWLIARTDALGKYQLVRTFPYINQERYARVPGLEGLEQKRVLLVGCGSVGSKIAANLAASGVYRFRLVDNDYYEPNNSVRHELGIECFGFNKEFALLNRLCSLNPLVAGNSGFLTLQVGGVNPFKLEQQFYDLVRESDLIINATGVHSVSHYLNELCTETGVPLIMAWVTNGAWAGEIIRVVPGKTPCYLCWLDHYHEQKPPSAPEPSGQLFAPGCDQPTFTGATHEVGFVANLATAMCIETLLSDTKETDLSKNYIRWSGRDKNGTPIYLTEILSTNAQNCWCQGL